MNSLNSARSRPIPSFRVKIAVVFTGLSFLFTSSATKAAEIQTPYAPTAKYFRRQASGGITALQLWYNPATGLYRTTGWWNSANAITALVDYQRTAKTKKYVPVLRNTFSAAQKTSPGFLNDYYDDEGWWALAWIDAYDHTHDAQYLAMARSIFTDMAAGWSDDVCGGGIWWSKKRDYKNAIANELFLSVAAHLANRVAEPADKAQYLSWAEKEWRWFDRSGLRNPQNLINDGLVSTNPAACVNNGKTTWTYNQGVVLGGLAELSKASGDPALLTAANAIAEAAIYGLTDAQGILHDTCEPRCGDDGIQFKGIFVRNLSALNAVSPRAEYKEFTWKNAASILAHSQGKGNQYGQVWVGPFDVGDAGSQTSALDAIVAAVEMGTPVNAR